MDINYIKECQQNRHPLLFVDKLIDLEPGKDALLSNVLVIMNGSFQLIFMTSQMFPALS